MQELSEADLHRFWRSSRYLKQALTTEDGRRLEVLRRGRHNRDAGPDFRGAALRLDGRPVLGDVEIHLDARDWLNHGHAGDPAYNGVILHVSLAEFPPLAAIRLENGCEAPQLLIPAEVVAQEAAPAAPPLLDCALSRESSERIVAVVYHAGDERFRQKAQAFRERLVQQSWDQLLYGGICEALGYSKNQKPFRRLADRVPIDLIFAELRECAPDEAELVASALLLGAAGFLSPPEKTGAIDAEIQRYLEPRRTLWQRLRHVLQIQPLQPEEWSFFRLRPTNFPPRRVAAVSKLVLRFYHAGMIETLAATALQGKTAQEVIAEFRKFFRIPADDFWQHHYDFKSRDGWRSRALGHLVGNARADDLIVNVVLPILDAYARETGQAVLQNRIHEAYNDFPALMENELTRRMRNQLGSADAGRSFPRGARFQQGLLHLCKNYCRYLYCEQCLDLRRPAREFQKET